MIDIELYDTDLRTLAGLLGYVEDVANNEDVEDLEIRIKLVNSDVWAVLGYGEAGDPCVLRFEPTTKVHINPNPFINPTPLFPYTINSDRPLGVSEYNQASDYV